MGFGILFLFVIGITLPLTEATTTEWSSEIVSKTYHWKAEKSELRHVVEYDEDMLGSLNVAGGDNAIHLRSIPPTFDIFAGERLDIDWTMEYDMLMYVPDDSDLHLLFLPLSMNGTNFFELLFSEQETLETLARSDFVNSTIETDKATATLKYNDSLDVVYKWDTSTGLLSRKEVTTSDGLQLIVVPGLGWGYGVTSQTTSTTETPSITTSGKPPSHLTPILQIGLIIGIGILVLLIIRIRNQ